MTLGGKTRAILKLRIQEGSTTFYLQGRRPDKALFVFAIDTKGGTHTVALDAEGKGELAGGNSVRAVLLTDGQEILASGGFAGDSAGARQAVEKYRIISSEKNTRTSRTDNEREESEEQPEPKPQQANARKEANRTENKPERSGEPAKNQGGSDALREILERAQLLFGPLAQQTGMPQQNPSEKENPKNIFNPFPDAFPNVKWKRVSYPGTSRYYLEGESQDRNGRYLLHAIPGEYSPIPPVHGFRRFLRATDGRGYWIRIRKVGN